MGQALAKLSATDFLKWEHEQPERHIFIAGEIYAMAGGTAEHQDATLATGSVLKAHLKDTRCKVFIEMRLRIEPADAYFYPDVLVTCDSKDIQNPKITEIQAAVLVIEVLSPSTVAFDRGLKFAHYRLLDSLQEYVLIDPDARTVEVFRKNAANIWELHPSNATSPAVTLKSVDWQGDIAQLLS